MFPNLSARSRSKNRDWITIQTQSPRRDRTPGFQANTSGVRKGAADKIDPSLRRALNHRLDSTVKNVALFVSAFARIHDKQAMESALYQRT
ncbi:MAG TPA: hypothetical protein VN937_17335 [Blastocatellia bacterium]|nr:hypothetical protein [Blastocatellia bacterium]